MVRESRVGPARKLSSKFKDHAAWIKFYGSRRLGASQYKCILRMPYMEGNLMWTEANFISIDYLKFDREKYIIFIVSQQIR